MSWIITPNFATIVWIGQQLCHFRVGIFPNIFNERSAFWTATWIIMEFQIAIPQKMKVWLDLSLTNCPLKQVGRRKFGKFTEQPIMNIIKVSNWRINSSPANLLSFTVSYDLYSLSIETCEDNFGIHSYKLCKLFIWNFWFELKSLK